MPRQRCKQMMFKIPNTLPDKATHSIEYLHFSPSWGGVHHNRTKNVMVCLDSPTCVNLQHVLNLQCIAIPLMLVLENIWTQAQDFMVGIAPLDGVTLCGSNPPPLPSDATGLLRNISFRAISHNFVSLLLTSYLTLHNFIVYCIPLELTSVDLFIVCFS